MKKRRENPDNFAIPKLNYTLIVVHSSLNIASSRRKQQTLIHSLQMNTFSNLARQRCSALATYSHASTRPNAQSSTSRRVPGRRSGNLIAPHQFAGPMSRPHRQVATHIWPFDQAWDPSLDVEVRHIFLLKNNILHSCTSI